MLFCPYDGNMLVIAREKSSLDNRELNCFSCNTCPYIFRIDGQYAERIRIERKEVDDVLGGDEAWANVPATAATCPKCEHDRAYHFMLQTRSADEPMTNFYKCERCKHDWKD